MDKVRFARLKEKKSKGAAKHHKPSVRVRHVQGPKGKKAKLYDVDSNDDNFDDDIAQVFRLNIDSARQANTTIFGSPDGPGKFNKTPKKTK